MTYSWHELYKAAVLETNWDKMPERLDLAESEIRKRQHELFQDHGGTPEENQALFDAMHRLTILRGELASWRGTQDRADR